MPARRGQARSLATLRETPRITLSAPCDGRSPDPGAIPLSSRAERGISDVRWREIPRCARSDKEGAGGWATRPRAAPLGARAVMRGALRSAALVGELQVKRARRAENPVSRKARSAA